MRRQPLSCVKGDPRRSLRVAKRNDRAKQRLKEMGWNVMTVWECQLRPAKRDATLLEIESLLNRSYLSQYRRPEAEEDYAMAAEPTMTYDKDI